MNRSEATRSRWQRAAIRHAFRIFLAIILVFYISFRGKSRASHASVTGSTRIVAIGDLHGDHKNALVVLRLAGLVDAQGDWIAGSTTLVQTGDIVDRGPDTIVLYQWIRKLTEQADKVGGKVIPLLGNHEVMNLMGDWRYVTEEDVASFGGEEARREAWSKEGWLGQYIRTWDLTTIVNNTVFLHGGLHPKWARRGIAALNNETHLALNTMSNAELRQLPLFHGDGPLWYRGYAQDPERIVCSLLEEALKTVNATRMVIGHTPQLDSGHILSRCNNRVHVIDVGISAVYGGNHAALEILGDRVTAIYDSHNVVIVNG
ncbi:Metallo-dependent phosphatase-like protein [Powellomyces hirtus]|nr:Metallo-dependent phosphatase-like protein [Powellomyces hirtus]